MNAVLVGVAAPTVYASRRTPLSTGSYSKAIVGQHTYPEVVVNLDLHLSETGIEIISFTKW